MYIVKRFNSFRTVMFLFYFLNEMMAVLHGDPIWFLNFYLGEWRAGILCISPHFWNSWPEIHGLEYFSITWDYLFFMKNITKHNQFCRLLFQKVYSLLQSHPKLLLIFSFCMLSVWFLALCSLHGTPVWVSLLNL